MVSRGPVEELEAGQEFYAKLLPGFDVSHFAALWHIFTVGHLVTTDLDRIARRLGFSMADLHLLGTLKIERPAALRATDLAMSLYVSNAVLSARIERLSRKGLLVRTPRPEDRRSYDLRLTSKGSALIEQAIVEIAREAKLVRHFRKLPDMDREALGRILGVLHEQLDRDFVANGRADG